MPVHTRSVGRAQHSEDTDLFRWLAAQLDKSVLCQVDLIGFSRPTLVSYPHARFVVHSKNPPNTMVAALATSAFVGQRLVVAPVVKPRAVAAPRVVASAKERASPALKLAVAGAVSLSLLAGAVPDALAASSPALDASSLYQKVEPKRVQSNRFSGTEAEALKNRKLGKTTTAPAPKAAPSSSKAAAPSKSAPAKSSGAKKTKKASGSSNGSTGGALAAVVLLGGAFAANAVRGDGGGEKKGDKKTSAPAKPAAASSGGDKTDTPEARAQSAQTWIDNSGWGGKSSPSAPAADTPEGRAAEAQAWIDAWKKTV